MDASDARCADVRRELLALVDQRLAAIDREMAELRVFRGEVEEYQGTLVACRLDEELLCSACHDRCTDPACMVPPGKESYQEESHEVSGVR